MTIRTLVALALTLGWLGCSKPEPETAKKPAAAAPAAQSDAMPAAAPTASPRRPVSTLPTIDPKPPADAPPNPRRAETPCDRKEAGWKWVGNIVENGQCIVGPCECKKD